MLRSLHIRNYVLIESLDVTFPEGLVIITGQTGAGKSILLGALSLVSGAKADASAISPGKENCMVEAEFGIDNHPEQIRRILEDADIEWDPEQLIIRRTVNASGRSRCFVNDTPAQLPVLAALAAHLIDIHSQHRSLLLGDRKFQMDVLDHFSGCSALVDECGAIWKDLVKSRHEREDLKQRLESLNGESEYNRAQFEQLKAAALHYDELETLEDEQKQLEHAGMIKENLEAAERMFADDGQGTGISQALKEISRMMSRISAYVPAAAQLCERMDSARIELDDIAQTIDDINLHTDLSSERLQAVEDRLSLIYSLLKKHNCRTVGELIDTMDSFAGALGDSSELEDRISDLDKKIAVLEGRYNDVCSKLHANRCTRAPEMAANIQASLRYLELERSVFAVEITEAPDGSSGRDAVTMKFSSTGASPVDLTKCASGGELSRIMLCLKAMMARFTGMPTLIFDEIDTGVSGSVADKMGTMICDMGRDMQVFSITHLPQVAAKGDAHYVVRKRVDADRTLSDIREVSGDDRIAEIARLLSGATVTPQAVENAKSLLGL